MEIKTVCKKIGPEGTPEFDETVNKLLADGWQLVKRGVIPDYDMGSMYFVPSIYAELVKVDQDEMEGLEFDPYKWEEAANVLRGICGTAEKCEDEYCPMFAWCQENLRYSLPPCKWKEPEECRNHG